MLSAASAWRRTRRRRNRRRRAAAAAAAPRSLRFGPYDRVITKDAKSDEGVFTVHRIKDRVYYEIPKDRLGREFLWVSQIAKTTLGAGYGGQAAGNRVVKWERRGDRIFLRAVSYDVVADAVGADREGGRGRELQPDRDGVQHRSARQG